MRSSPRTVFVALLLLCIAQAVYYYPLLPERVASHFGASGRPDAWSGKESFIMIYLAAVSLTTFLFAGLGFTLRKVPVSLINLPNRDYWLSPERRQQTISDLTRQFLWFGSATLLLLLDVFHQTLRVNLGKAQTLAHPVASIAVYLGFAVLWGIALVAKFKRRPRKM